MISDYYELPWRLAQVRGTCVGPYLDDFSTVLTDAGYSPFTIRGYLRAADHLAGWADRRRVPITSWNDDILVRFARHLCRCSCFKCNKGVFGDAVAGVRLLLARLRARGVIAAATVVPITPRYAAISEQFADWTLQHRGLATTTAARYQRVLRPFLEALGEDPKAYTVAGIRGYVIKRLGSAGRGETRNAVAASRHAWLEERGPLLFLMAAVDDATGEVMPGAHFIQQESGAGYLRVLKETCTIKGIPLAIYMDQHGSLKRNDGYWTLEEELAGEQKPTQVGQAMDELGIRVIHALSPQAKGRVERLWGVLQDRLVSEMRVAGATTRDEAQAVLEAFLPAYNKRFGVPPREAVGAFLKVPPGMKLERVCSFRYPAVVGNDNAVRTCGEVIDIPPGPSSRSYAKARVDVRQLLDGRWQVYLQDQLLAEKQGSEATELRAKKRTRTSAGSKAFKHAVKTWQAIPRRPQDRPVRKKRSPGGITPFNTRPRTKKSATRVTKSLCS